MHHRLASVFAQVNEQWVDPSDRLAAQQEARALLFEVVMERQEAVGELLLAGEPGHVRGESLYAVSRVADAFLTVSFPKNGHAEKPALLVEYVDGSPDSL